MRKSEAKKKYKAGDIQIYYDVENVELLRDITESDQHDGLLNKYYCLINKHGISEISHAGEIRSCIPVVSISKITEDEDLNFNGIKESEGKLFYELDFGFITQMAERMECSGDKYPVFNWKKPTDIELIKQALFRHVIAVMNGDFEDDGRELGHLEAIATNAMLINYQLKNK